MTNLDTRIDWTLVVNFDNHGSQWGYDTADQAELDIQEARTNGAAIDEWHVTARGGLPIRIVRITDPDFLDTISVFPAECPDCGAPVTTTAWVSEEHHPKCPHRDPYFQAGGPMHCDCGATPEEIRAGIHQESCTTRDGEPDTPSDHYDL